VVNLVVDAGNTFVKIGIYNSNELIRLFKWDYTIDIESQLLEITQNYSIQNAAISSVVNLDLLDVFKLFFPNILLIHSNSVFPFLIQYDTPETLGVDRLIGLTSAFYYANSKPFLVLDLGTCITYDYVDKNNVFIGGGISPGLLMRLKAMHEFTSKLPLVDYFNLKPKLIGSSTNSCMQSGAWYGVLGEINYIIGRYQENNPDLQVFLTGGDAFLFVDDIKSKIFARPNLLLEGLNRLIQIDAK
jgi:type III pantothenate kinase